MNALRAFDVTRDPRRQCRACNDVGRLVELTIACGTAGCQTPRHSMTACLCGLIAHDAAHELPRPIIEEVRELTRNVARGVCAP